MMWFVVWRASNQKGGGILGLKKKSVDDVVCGLDDLFCTEVFWQSVGA
jgi:hypothetical protein